ncbi:conserved hypothetical protein [Trichinella spiralis]|uniref:hypothetical protein n=1 Tax=Trichinella spiralis TaxID=6334 RepID=UPI0001EFEACD|nr:conserved hypothetical protein [Trichinella spiralis]
MDASLSTVLRAFIIDWQQFHCTFVFTQFSKNVSIQDPTITGHIVKLHCFCILFSMFCLARWCGRESQATDCDVHLKKRIYTPMSSSLTAVMQITRHTSSALDDKRRM